MSKLPANRYGPPSSRAAQSWAAQPPAVDTVYTSVCTTARKFHPETPNTHGQHLALSQYSKTSNIEICMANLAPEKMQHTGFSLRACLSSLTACGNHFSPNCPVSYLTSHRRPDRQACPSLSTPVPATKVAEAPTPCSAARSGVRRPLPFCRWGRGPSHTAV